MSDTRPAKAPMKMPKAKANGASCKHNPTCSLFDSIAALSLRFDTLAKQLEARATDAQARVAGEIYELKNRTTVLQQREEQVQALLRDATRVMAENQVVIAAATLAIKEARHA